MLSGIGSSRLTSPVDPTLFRWEYGANARSRTISSTPILRSTFMEFGIIWMPAPILVNWLACS
jgi:hypothetical protein